MEINPRNMDMIMDALRDSSGLSGCIMHLYLSTAMAPIANEDMKTGVARQALAKRHRSSVPGPKGQRR